MTGATGRLSMVAGYETAAASISPPPKQLVGSDTYGLLLAIKSIASEGYRARAQ